MTKGQQWLKSTDKLELLDTPGILWPKFSSQEVADKLALTGAIKESVYASDDIALFGLKQIRQLHPEGLKDRYHLTDDDLDLSDVDLLLQITKKVGMRDDYERGSNRIIQDFRAGKIGRFTLDDPETVSDDDQANN